MVCCEVMKREHICAMVTLEWLAVKLYSACVGAECKRVLMSMCSCRVAFKQQARVMVTLQWLVACEAVLCAGAESANGRL